MLKKGIFVPLLGVAGMKCLRPRGFNLSAPALWFSHHQISEWEALGIVIPLSAPAWCLRHFSPATPNRGTNMPFLIIRNTNLDYRKNA